MYSTKVILILISFSILLNGCILLPKKPSDFQSADLDLSTYQVIGFKFEVSDHSHEADNTYSLTYKDSQIFESSPDCLSIEDPHLDNLSQSVLICETVKNLKRSKSHETILAGLNYLGSGVTLKVSVDFYSEQTLFNNSLAVLNLGTVGLIPYWGDYTYRITFSIQDASDGLKIEQSYYESYTLWRHLFLTPFMPFKSGYGDVWRGISKRLASNISSIIEK